MNPHTFVTYAQNREDIILAGLLKHVDKGFYVDVGANDPLIDSVTKYFSERGWKGINIEPVKEIYEQLVKDRPLDININCAIGDEGKDMIFREFINMPGRSTLSSQEKKMLETKGEEFREYKIKVKTLKSIFDANKVKTIDFMKIDVEGFEYEVLSGNDWNKYRPKVISIEADHINKDWHGLINKNGYIFTFNDGLNEYFVATEHKQLMDEFNFSEDVVGKSYHAMRYHHYQQLKNSNEGLLKLQKQFVIKQQNAHDLRMRNEYLENKISEIDSYSLKDKRFLSRAKITIKGLTADMVHFYLSRLKKKKNLS